MAGYCRQFCLVLLALCAGQWVSAQEADVDYEWKLKRDREGIQVYLSKVPGSKFRAIRAQMEIEAETASLVALVMDLPNCSKWAAMCKEARIHERLSDTESYVYTLNDVPFPVRDRDVIARVKWVYDAESGKVSMLSHATKDKYPKTKGVIRVEEAVSQWHFTPLPGGMVLVESFAHVDPNGATPAWLTNMLMVDSPYKTMKKMRKLLDEGKYEDAQIAFMSG